MTRFKVNSNISKPEVLESRLQMASVSVAVHVRCHVRCHWSCHVTYRYLSDLFELTQSWQLLLGKKKNLCLQWCKQYCNNCVRMLEFEM